MKKHVYLYDRFERFWHWSQALLIFFLIITGFEIHSTYQLFGYEHAVHWHNVAGWAFIVLLIFAVFWHIITGEWRQYIPTRKNFRAQINYYLLGIFRNAPHPTRKSQLSKLNPLQRVVYLALNILVIPVMAGSGLLYMYYRYPNNPIALEGVEIVALLHTAGAFLVMVFIVIHVYLITTGQTIFSNLMAMLTGYEEVEHEEPEPPKVEETKSETVKEEVIYQLY
jgi:thiosulfate reductase cytochrome b subunit